MTEYFTCSDSDPLQFVPDDAIEHFLSTTDMDDWPTEITLMTYCPSDDPGYSEHVPDLDEQISVAKWLRENQDDWLVEGDDKIYAWVATAEKKSFDTNGEFNKGVR